MKELKEQEDTVSTTVSTIVATQELAVMLGKRVFFKLLKGDISRGSKPEITIFPPKYRKKATIKQNHQER